MDERGLLFRAGKIISKNFEIMLYKPMGICYINVVDNSNDYHLTVQRTE